MAGALANKHVVLGVTGSIACYKALDLASKLVQAGALVDIIMSYGATQFVTPLAFRSITHRTVVIDSFDPESEYSVEHVALAQQADVIVVAPATVHCIAKLALGLADDPLTTTIVAAKCPLVVAPAMDGNMYDHPATQSNIATLKKRGVVIAGPGTGRLASGLSGVGRLLETQELLGYISYTIGKDGDLAGRTVVVSAGGTMEPIDPVRVITNHSSGKMGYALAEAARDRGADVVLVTAPTSLPDPALVNVVQIRTAEQMGEAIQRHLDKADALVMAAAVADYRPATAADQKIKKAEDEMNISLAKTTDILKSAEGNYVRVGFAAESQNLVENAKAKVASKKLDLIVANDITAEGSGFGSETNQVTFIDRYMQVEELPLLTKYDVSNRILDRVRDLIRD
ncbi:MAG: bifunctional phosphopantothenoylcysteine decarboxylase/phosphopantothenate--cysteine ligase CoaBC [Chloroflexota bacterium]|nr:bifunctional phosphopantothenoylcysteine decarboxylase/phosphopantothenate--cysteine ligase CoaBC [Dehalococcoidia bacterium]MEC8909914.1 bifunctional phosphopantothenoylcysteine decarboxylase/phosphopantothenate--cysteine ligase CoaBC [Chloroflexota bacterium]MEC8960153.1 bifunctional phosphopantothenoylcysteine decarboxylase/phosphopantothenate--cysteine ligase CoaBC [Chloroflexota bacterium]MEE3248215.1 bifunctional phosphopantothenoylcysteine decarboxylase/phosphopantothenate--cysteine li|tara:strand:- start:2689 stop:3885 length:1197 start_codon:yes stop_codon:yes gene_type:complete